MIDDAIQHALATDRTIDITTIGRTSGQLRRIETWFYRVGDTIYLSGSPGKRDWYANLVANPDFTFHLKGSVTADLPAQATPITDPAARREIFETVVRSFSSAGDLDDWVARSPLMAVRFPGLDRS